MIFSEKDEEEGDCEHFKVEKGTKRESGSRMGFTLGEVRLDVDTAVLSGGKDCTHTTAGEIRERAHVVEQELMPTPAQLSLRNQA
jgi:hypothetical protein